MWTWFGPVRKSLYVYDQVLLGHCRCVKVCLEISLCLCVCVSVSVHVRACVRACVRLKSPSVHWPTKR